MRKNSGWMTNKKAALFDLGDLLSIYVVQVVYEIYLV